ncbi:NADH:ubiquinone reductase (Na(+)-transporting) subunit F [Pontivivens ytuae]|uniref:Na(+)-translocating NADH-quinone reductase subunit F n=1 Tax=Pontivivens ytuae TaxID=2789856 RepID=A0A7S9LUF6_9RHOB|nr:NADH:ubiquinone reductase (Na(+)-transporting) subunit F [Pontivivens ytuae]QPH54960.1 NADH:ubiquinone reductase (Na(+)-transporting) subunit F [Pontivivens ytuae]
MTEILFGSFVVVALVLTLSAVVMLARALLMPAEPATLTVNGAMAIDTVTGEKLLSALKDNGVLVPSACAGAGTCGLCRVQVTEGAPATLPVEAAKFTKAEIRDGFHLACQVVLRNDMAVQVPEDLIGAESYVTTVLSTRALTPLIREIVLQVPMEMEPDVFAGSFIEVTAPPYSLNYADLDIPEAFAEVWEPLRGLRVSSDEEVTRAYSISNRAEDTEAKWFVLNIRLALPPPSSLDAPPGFVSSWLFALRPGDEVRVAGPFGSFRARDTEREMVFIGGGVGMAPLRALIHEQLADPASNRKMSLWYGARGQAELFYADEMDALAAEHDRFSWTVAFSDPGPSDTREAPTGFIHVVAFETYLRDHPAPEACEYYLCGPPLMIRAVLAMLDDLGVERDSIFLDDFGV